MLFARRSGPVRSGSSIPLPLVKLAVRQPNVPNEPRADAIGSRRPTGASAPPHTASNLRAVLSPPHAGYIACVPFGALELGNFCEDLGLSASGECPGFEEAANRFKAFLLENGWPTEIVWVRSPEHPERLQPSEVKREYEFGRHQGLGVCLYAIRVVGGSAFAVVEYPRDSDEAERLMYPSDGGLKLSVAVTGDDGWLSQMPLRERNT